MTQKSNEAPLAQVLPALLSSAGVAEVLVDQIERPPSFRGRSVSEEARNITAVARSEHVERGFGFWEFVLERTPHVDRNTRIGLLEGALNHSSNSDATLISMSIEQLEEKLSAGVWEQMPARTMVSLCSRVVLTDGQEAHLVMLDFGVPATRDSAADAALDVIATLGLSGALFTSGRSFHFVSNQVFSESALIAVLARAQLLSPLIDSRWVSHQLMDQECRLRISTDVDRNPTPHRLVHLD